LRNRPGAAVELPIAGREDVMLWLPGVSAEVTTTAELFSPRLLSVAVPIRLPLSKTFTVPVGKNVETVGVAGEMTTLKLTFWPVVLGLGDAMITDFVSLVLTVTVAEPVLAPKLPSPG
jgi:hypothetical protein